MCCKENLQNIILVEEIGDVSSVLKVLFSASHLLMFYRVRYQVVPVQGIRTFYDEALD